VPIAGVIGPVPAPGDEAQVDPRADVHPDADLAPGCVVGPFAVVGADVRLGARCRVHEHAVVQGPTWMGDDNEIFPFACVGGAPQDRRHRSERTRLAVGHGNVFREYVTVSRGTAHGGSVTTLGDHNMLMACCHVAHDCTLGSNITMANHATLAGHVFVEDHVVFGGMVAVGAFLRIGESAMLAAGAMVERDVPPFCIVAGDRARLRGVNRVGLDRRGIGQEAREQIKAIFKGLRRGEPVKEIAQRLRAAGDPSAEASRMLAFLMETGRGVAR